MGRPADKFCWDNVDKLPNSRWRCKHCQEEFSGAASRIRIHLSGSGNDIGSCEIRRCEAVPSHVREEALKGALKKRRRSLSSGEGNDGISATNRTEVAAAPANNSLDMATALQVSFFNGDLRTNGKKGSDQDTTDALVEFFVSRNIPVDAIKDQCFTTLLKRVAQHGFPSCLLRNDFVGIQKSVSNLEYEVNEYMLMVKESWKTTGCTLICYRLNEGRGNPSALATDNVVYGFYCPKGFIFVEGRQLDFSQGFQNAFKNHVLNLPMEEVLHEILHSRDLWCEFIRESDEWDVYNVLPTNCIHQEVQDCWAKIYRKTEWVHTLIQASENLYEFILNSDFYEDWREEMVEKDEYDLPTRSFTHLGSIMHLEDKIKTRLSDMWQLDLGIREIITNKEFWSNGKDLLKVLTPLIGIIDLVDTLVPNVGYLLVAIDKAKHNLKPYYEREVSKYHMIKGCLDSLSMLGNEETTFLSLIYNAWRAVEGDLDPTHAEWYLRDYMVQGEETEEVVAEFKDYISKNPFARLSSSEWKNNHPVTLWNKHGDEFPLLKKCAIKLLSQPGSCMCKQVKKQMLHCQGKDNFILRLNYHMMQQFTKLGDRIYEPPRLKVWMAMFVSTS